MKPLSMAFKQPRLLTGFLCALSCAAMLSAGPALAQDAQKKAQDGVTGYMAVMATAVTCKIEVDKAAKETTEFNINALQPLSKWTDKELQVILETAVADLSKEKDFCKLSTEQFDLALNKMAKSAFDASEGSGIALRPMPATKVSMKTDAKGEKSPKEKAMEMMNLAIMLEAVADHCEADLEDEETLSLTQAQYYWRGMADASAKEFRNLQNFWKEDVKKNTKKVCAKDFGFRAAFNEMVETIK